MRAIERAFRLLDVLSEQEGSVGIIELSERVGLPPSTLHRLLGVLIDLGFAVQEPASRRYRLGPGVLRLAKGYLQQNTLIAAAQPYLMELRSRVQETVFLTALVGDDAICVATAESPRPLRFFMRVGQRMPYHAAASARAILAYRPLPERERLLRRDLPNRFTDVTPTSVEEVMRELDRIRAQGFAVCAEEMEVGVTALAAPVRDAAGEVIASVTIVAPTMRFSSATRREEGLAELRASAAAISSALGYQPAGHARQRAEAQCAERAADA